MKKLITLLTFLMLATLGWLANDLYNTAYAGSPRMMERAKDFATIINGLPEKPLPADRISEDKIKVLPDKIIIEVPNARWATFTPTHSMSPVFDAGSNVIQIIPQSNAEIKAGDIVSYTWQDGSTIIHRVIEIGNDENGWFAITKGDNSPYADPEKVRFSQIKKVVIGIIY